MITTERLTLRPWEDTDADALYKYAREPKVSQMALWPTHTSVEMSRWVIHNIFIPNPDTYAIILNETNEAIGCIGLVPCGDEHYPTENGEREMGYWVGLPYWGKGLMTEALQALIRELSTRGDIKTLLITTATANIASQRVAEKCGFVLIDKFKNEGIPSNAYRKNLITLKPY